MKQTHTICHCGKCEVKCNKHNKIAKCSDCKKRRKLGTVIEKGVMRHICNPCCIVYEDKLNEEFNKALRNNSPPTEPECLEPIEM